MDGVEAHLARIAQAREFGPQERWNGWFAPNGAQAGIGDFNGDGLVDIITPGLSSGKVYVSLSSGNGFVGIGNVWTSTFLISTGKWATGDFNGDGKDDIVRTTPIVSGGGRPDVYVALSTGTSFGPEALWRASFSTSSLLVGDFNGDGRDDVGYAVDAFGPDFSGYTVMVALSTGSSFGTTTAWLTQQGSLASESIFRVGDVNGDGRDDLVRFASDSSGNVFVGVTGTSSFAGEVLWHDNFAASQPAAYRHVADVNGDGMDDLVHFTSTGETFAAFSTRWSFGPAARYGTDFDLGTGFGLVGDCDGDGFADQIRFANDSTGLVFVSRFNPFGYNVMTTNDGSHAVGTRPLLVVLANTPGREALWAAPPSAFAAAVAQVPGFFSWNSNGKFTYSVAGVLGPVTVDETDYPGGDGIEKRMYAAIDRVAQDGFRFTQFDVNGDGKVTPAELEMVVIDNFGSGGANRAFNCRNNIPGHPSTFQVCLHSSIAVGHTATFRTLLHEIAHGLGTIDVYGAGTSHSYNVTLMSSTIDGLAAMTTSMAGVHLDPWHKMMFGWSRPRVRPLNGEDTWTWLSSPRLIEDFDTAPMLLYDPELGMNQFFIVEARTRSTSATQFDQRLSNASGIAIWQVTTAGAYVPVYVDGAPRMMTYGASTGIDGGSALWQPGSASAILALEGSELTPNLDVISIDAVVGIGHVEFNRDACHPSVRGTATHCSHECPCSEGAGDCDPASDECAFGLMCVNDVGAQFGFSSATDVCLRSCHAAKVQGTVGYCLDSCPCGEGMGQCTSDSQCVAGLVCVTGICRSPI